MEPVKVTHAAAQFDAHGLDIVKIPFQSGSLTLSSPVSMS